jgi:hypothetical protein
VKEENGLIERSSGEIVISGISVKNSVGSLNTNVQNIFHSAAGLVVLRHPVKPDRGIALATFLFLAVADMWLGLLQEAEN